jgi:hypothetical protein
VCFLTFERERMKMMFGMVVGFIFGACLTILFLGSAPIEREDDPKPETYTEEYKVEPSDYNIRRIKDSQPEFDGVLVEDSRGGFFLTVNELEAILNE